MRGVFRSVALVAFGALVVSACGREGRPQAIDRGKASVSVSTPRPAKPAPEAKAVPAALHAFADCAEVTRTLRTQALRYVGPYGLQGGFGYGGDVVAMEATTAGSAKAAGGPVADSSGAQRSAAAPAPSTTGHSDTNVQEQGVDEPDLIETDGRRIFAVSNQSIHAADITGDTPKLVGKITLPISQPQIMLAGNRLTVIGGEQPTGGPEPRSGGPELMIAPAYSEKTLVQIVDVSDPAHMKIESTLHLDGSLVASRAVAGVARVVIRKNQPELGLVSPQNAEKTTVDRALLKNKDIVSKAPVEKWIPRFKLEKHGNTSEGALSSCRTTYEPRPFGGFGTVSVVTIDPASPTPREGSSVIGGGEIVYASEKGLYVTSLKQPDPQPLPAQGGPGIANDAAVSSAPASPIETQIHKFDISGDTAKYVASGIVKGTLLNQFSMSELDGKLRIASTVTSFSTGSQSESGVSVFEQKDAALVQIGHVGGLGRGEQIKSVRFIGTVGYVVTFLQIDPLYTIDLSNPSAPRVAGELEMPGFSAYLHPIDDDHVLGIGVVANAKGETHDPQGHFFGNKVSLFDVSDPAHVKEVSSLKLAGAEQMWEFDHHAFLWFAPKKIAVLPVQNYADTDGFVGAVVMRVDGADGVKWMRRIAHPVKEGDRGFAPPISRSVINNDDLYTLSQYGLLDTLLTQTDKNTWLRFN